MNFFIVNQNQKSIYDDEEGKRYHYPTSIPNGKKISVGDILIFNMSKADARKNGDSNKRISGLAKIDRIDKFKQGGKEYGIASYQWYRELDETLSFDQIGGDPRNNIQNAMSIIDNKDIIGILIGIIKG